MQPMRLLSVIIDFRQNRRIATLNASARAAEYQLNEDVDFLIADPRWHTAHCTANRLSGTQL